MISEEKELAIIDVLLTLEESIIPGAVDFEFPQHNLSLKFHEANTTIKILKWVLANGKPSS